MIKLALVGYGKMGKEIESILDPNEFELYGKYDIDNKVQDNTCIADVAIEFSTPDSFINNLKHLASKKINVVCGTTGWYAQLDKVKQIVNDSGIGFIYASNFSVGVNLFFKIVKNASVLMNKFPQYDVIIEETHHTQKLDKPSGTAIRASEYVMSEFKKKSSYVSDKPQPSENELNIISKRIENVVGNHKVIFRSDADTIILEHDANSRRGFAEGALLAAKFIHGKKGFYKFEDIFNELT